LSSRKKSQLMNIRENLFIRRLSCPICQSYDLSVLFNVPQSRPDFLDFLKIEKFYSKKFYDAYFNGLFKGIVFEIVECKKCNFIFQSEVLNEEGMELLYNNWLDKDLLLKYYSDMKPDIYQYNLLRIIKKFYKKKLIVNVLDFGAGYGNFCILSSELGFNTHAFDLSIDKNNHLSTKYGIKIINDLDHFKSFFDFIFINQVLEHISNPTEILAKLQNCLGPTGIIFISVPNCQHIGKTIKNHGLSNELFLHISPHQHINAFNNKTLRLLGKKSGLKELNINDFLKLFNWTLTISEMKFLLKATIKSSISISTSLLFHKNE
jgi:2-polyprenyl-3-methyl-5-hydroxy-6-metoxy-1,4-benzoquinol methylase